MGQVLPQLVGLTKARELYTLVQQTLNERQENRRLSEVELKTLRNCYFAIGATWFDLGEYENAIRAYTAASTRYQNSPEALEAYVQIARAYQRTSNPEEARATLKRAEEVLKRLESQADFLQATTNGGHRLHPTKLARRRRAGGAVSARVATAGPRMQDPGSPLQRIRPPNGSRRFRR